MSRRQVFLAALIAAFLLVLIAFFPIPEPVARPLQVSILGQTNEPSGAPVALAGVTNHTGRARWFYFVAEVPTTNGLWTTANGWVERQQPLWHRLAAHAECQVSTILLVSVVLPASCAIHRLSGIFWLEKSS